MEEIRAGDTLYTVNGDVVDIEQVYIDDDLIIGTINGTIEDYWSLSGESYSTVTRNLVVDNVQFVDDGFDDIYDNYVLTLEQSFDITVPERV